VFGRATITFGIGPQSNFIIECRIQRYRPITTQNIQLNIKWNNWKSGNPKGVAINYAIWFEDGSKPVTDGFEAGSKLVADLQRAEIWPTV